MPQLILSRGNASKKNILRRIFPGLEPGPYLLIGSLIAFVVLTTVITLMFSTSQVTKGYLLNRLEATHQDLVKEMYQLLNRRMHVTCQKLSNYFPII